MEGIRRCRPKVKKARHRITAAVDNEVWQRFQVALLQHWEGSFTSWLEYAMECFSRDRCDGCPYAPEEGYYDKASGVGKILEKAKLPN